MRTLHFVTTGLVLCYSLAAQTAADHVPGRIIVHHYAQTSDPAATAAFTRHGARVHAHLDRLQAWVVDVTPGTEDAVMQSLRANPLFRDAELDHYARPAATTPNDPQFSSQWHLARIQAPAAWDITTGSSTPIAVLDSGVDTNHPDLAGRLLPGWNFTNNSSNVTDTTGHGTAVTGVLGAVTNNWGGVSAAIWQNPILPLVVVDSSNYASYSNIGAAIQYAVDHGARVISLSVGGSASSGLLQSAVDYAWNAGAVVVAAAMNNSSSTPYYPAACNHAIAVSASDNNDNLAGFSNFGNWITVSAPGTTIWTTNLGGGYQPWDGTSLATPVAASVAALALAANPSLTAQGVVNVLEQSADDIGPSGYDTSFGWGRVNAYRAVVLARGGSVTTPTPPPTPVPTLSGPPYRIHSGGAALTDASGLAWSSDGDYSGGAAWATTASISATSSPALYQSCRYGAFTYTLPLSNGNYIVTLKFAELTRFGPGMRQFNVAINGTPVLSNFDIYAQAGGGNRAIDESFPVTVTGGQVVIQFTAGAVDLPLVNAIDVEAGTPVIATSNSVRVNAGGSTYTDPSGQSWSGDANFSGGNTFAVGSSISNTPSPGLYQSCRYGNFVYTFAVPSGNYNVTLKFAEPTRFGVGQRVFNVAINGTPVLNNFDIYAQAGGGLIALDKTFAVNASGGTVTVQFTSGLSDVPLVNGIEIEPGSGAPPTSSTGVRVRAGGGSYTDASGNAWAADNSYSGGGTWSTAASISNTATPALYQTCRYGNFTYTFAVPNGNYAVTLKFAEIARTGAGQRLFNVALNGSQVLSNFDIFAQAGGANVAMDKTLAVNVSGGQITLQFYAGAADLPMVNAIDIEPGSGSSSLPSFFVHAGGGSYVDSGGTVWAADNSYSGGAAWSTGSSIQNTAAPALYQSCRYGAFGYTFSVPNGNYNVTLKFAEISLTGPGQRLFNVSINGSQVLSNFDIYAQSGGTNRAMDKTIPVTVSGGQISIQFTNGAANLPLVNSLSIIPY